MSADINMQKLAEEIAAHLPGGWKPGKPVESDWGPSHSACIEHDHGYAIRLYHDTYRKRISCSGRYPTRDGPRVRSKERSLRFGGAAVCGGGIMNGHGSVTSCEGRRK